MIRAIAIDDEPLALELIEKYCRSFDFLQLEKSFTSTIAALKFLEEKHVHLIFLDINMPSVSGIDFYKSLQNKPMLILTTSYSEFALDGYEINAIDYLLKPFSIARFEKAISKVCEMQKLIDQSTADQEERCLMMKVDYGAIKILISDILFIEGLDNYLKVYLIHQKPIILRSTMKFLQTKLPSNKFIRVHKSYIVSLKYVESIRNKCIRIGDKEIPIGKSYKNQFRAEFQNRSKFK